jgi:hypothetical protein
MYIFFAGTILSKIRTMQSMTIHRLYQSMCFGSGARFSGHVAVHFFQSEFSLQKTVCAGEPSTKIWSTKHGLALSFS